MNGFFSVEGMLKMTTNRIYIHTVKPIIYNVGIASNMVAPQPFLY